MRARKLRCAGFIHTYMSIHTKTQNGYINASMFQDKIFCFHPGHVWIFYPSIKKYDLLILDIHWMKELKVEMKPAAAFIFSIHACPFIKSHKHPAGGICFSAFGQRHQFFV